MESLCKETSWLPYIHGIYVMYCFQIAYICVILICCPYFHTIFRLQMYVLHAYFPDHVSLNFQIVSISKSHTCASTSQVKGKEASKVWIADRAKEMLKSDPAMGAKKLQNQLEQQFQSSYHITRCGKDSNLLYKDSMALGRTVSACYGISKQS